MLSESDHKEVDVHVELDGSDDVEITMDETVEREELEVTTGKLDETDGTLIFTLGFHQILEGSALAIVTM